MNSTHVYLNWAERYTRQGRIALMQSGWATNARLDARPHFRAACDMRMLAIREVPDIPANHRGLALLYVEAARSACDAGDFFEADLLLDEAEMRAESPETQAWIVQWRNFVASERMHVQILDENIT